MDVRTIQAKIVKTYFAVFQAQTSIFTLWGRPKYSNPTRDDRFADLESSDLNI